MPRLSGRGLLRPRRPAAGVVFFVWTPATSCHPSAAARRQGWPWPHYLSSSYYEHWFTGAATLAVEGGLVTRQELEERAGGPFPLSGPVHAGEVHVPPPHQAHFAVGDAVRVRNMHRPGHTRCPGYVR